MNDRTQAKGNTHPTREQKLAQLVQELRTTFKRQHFTASEFLAACDSDPELQEAAKQAFRKPCRHRTAAGVLLKRACGTYGQLQLKSEFDGHVKALRFSVVHDNDAAETERKELEADAKQTARKTAHNFARRLARSYVKHGLPKGDEPVTADQCLAALQVLHRCRGPASVVKLLRSIAGADKWADVHAIFYALLLKEAKALTDAVKVFSDPVEAGRQEVLRATAVYQRDIPPPRPTQNVDTDNGSTERRAARMAEIEAELARHGRTGVDVADILRIDDLRGSPWTYGMSINPADHISYTDRRVFQPQQLLSRRWSVFDT